MGTSGDKWCKHRTPLSREVKECKVGVDFHQFEIPGGWDMMPCLGQSPEAIARCPKYCGHTAEELAEQERDMEERWARMGTIRKAIVAHIDATNEWSGSIPCPACESGTVRYSRAHYNKHIHASCSTPNCASWME